MRGILLVLLIFVIKSVIVGTQPEFALLNIYSGIYYLQFTMYI